MPRKRKRRKKKQSPQQQVDEIVSHRHRRRLRNLSDEIESGYKNMATLRAEHASCIGFYAGPHHPSGKNTDRRPINTFQRAVAAYMSHLAGADPEAMIMPKVSPDMDILSKVLSARLTALLHQIKYRRSKQLMTVDALCGWMVGCVGLKLDDYSYDIDGHQVNGTKPCFWRIAPPDYVPDPAASGRHDLRYEGHRYRASLDRIEGMAGLDRSQIDMLPEWREREQGRDSLSVGMGETGRQNADRDGYWHDLIDVYVKPGYLSREPLIVTLRGNTSHPDFLTARDRERNPIPVRTVEYEGHEDGPYIYQDIHPVPDSVIGTSPAPGWKQLDIMVNMLGRHIVDSESRRKKGIVYGEGEEDTVRQMLEAPDQFALRLNPQQVAAYEVGGSSSSAWQNLSGFFELFSRQSGNTDQLSGQGPARSGDTTATEVASIEKALTVMLDSMETQMGEFDDEVVRRLAWYDLTDPMLEEVITISNMGVQLPVTLTPEVVREQVIDEYHYKVRLGSMRRKDKAQIAGERRQAVAVIAAALQMEQLSQGGISAKKYFAQSAADLYSQAEIDQWWADPDIRQQAAMMAGAPDAKSKGTGGGPSLSTVGGMQSNVGTLGALQTGNQSPAFDQAALPQQTRQGMGF